MIIFNTVLFSSSEIFGNKIATNTLYQGPSAHTPINSHTLWYVLKHLTHLFFLVHPFFCLSVSLWAVLEIFLVSALKFQWSTRGCLCKHGRCFSLYSRALQRASCNPRDGAAFDPLMPINRSHVFWACCVNFLCGLLLVPPEVFACDELSPPDKQHFWQLTAGWAVDKP